MFTRVLIKQCSVRLVRMDPLESSVATNKIYGEQVSAKDKESQNKCTISENKVIISSIKGLKPCNVQLVRLSLEECKLNNKIYNEQVSTKDKFQNKRKMRDTISENEVVTSVIEGLKSCSVRLVRLSLEECKLKLEDKKGFLGSKTNFDKLFRKLNLRKTSQQYNGSRRFKCIFCKKMYAQNFNLQIHLRRHLNEKPFSYSNCDKTFPNTLMLKQHDERLHFKTGDTRPNAIMDKAKCPICEKEYANKHILKTHIAFKHEKLKPSKCNICGYTCFNVHYLNRHLLTHVPRIKRAEVLKCTKCDNIYCSKGALTQHYKTEHLEIRPYQCELCPKYCPSQALLEDHIRTHLNETPFKCEGCARRFCKELIFKQHMKKCHVLTKLEKKLARN